MYTYINSFHVDILINIDTWFGGKKNPWNQLGSVGLLEFKVKTICSVITNNSPKNIFEVLGTFVLCLQNPVRAMDRLRNTISKGARKKWLFSSRSHVMHSGERRKSRAAWHHDPKLLGWPKTFLSCSNSVFALEGKNPFLPSYVSSMSTPTLSSASTPHSPSIPAYALDPFSEQLYIYYLVVIKNLIVLYFLLDYNCLTVLC